MPIATPDGRTSLFTIVTPCRNAAGLVQDTVRSVLSQSALRSGRARLQYVVQDGLSSDTTLDEIAAVVAEAGLGPEHSVTVVSEADGGMYDALARGLRVARGDVIANINAGDYYSPTCFDAVLDGLAAGDASWLTGMRVLYNASGHVIDVRVPGPYRRDLMLAGFYGLRGRHGFLQQESTFWTRDLQQHLDLDALAEFRLAGDYYIWRTFASHAELHVLYSHLGGFRFHGGHLSADMTSYREEMLALVQEATPGAWALATWDLATQQLPVRIRRHLNGRNLLAWDQEQGRYRTGGRSRATAGRAVTGPEVVAGSDQHPREVSAKQRAVAAVVGAAAAEWAAEQKWRRRVRAQVQGDRLLAAQWPELASYRNKHVGERCVIIGNGPSLRRTDMSLLKDEVTFGLNRVYLAFDEWGYSTTYHVAVNKYVTEQSGAELARLISSPLFTTYANAEHFASAEKQPLFLLNSRPPGFYGDVRFGLWEGATVTYVAMQLAFYMGFTDVVLVGVDHRFSTVGAPHTLVESTEADPNHFDGRYFGPGYRWQLPDLETSEYAYRLARTAFLDDGRRIRDATVDGALDVYPKVDLEHAVGRAR